jgi:hypothetical protein
LRKLPGSVVVELILAFLSTLPPQASFTRRDVQGYVLAHTEQAYSHLKSEARRRRTNVYLQPLVGIRWIKPTGGVSNYQLRRESGLAEFLVDVASLADFSADGATATDRAMRLMAQLYRGESTVFFDKKELSPHFGGKNAQGFSELVGMLGVLQWTVNGRRIHLLDIDRTRIRLHLSCREWFRTCRGPRPLPAPMLPLLQAKIETPPTLSLLSTLNIPAVTQLPPSQGSTRNHSKKRRSPVHPMDSSDFKRARTDSPPCDPPSNWALPSPPSLPSLNPHADMDTSSFFR